MESRRPRIDTNAIARFEYATSGARVIFGAGARASVADQIERLGRRHAFVLSTPQQKEGAEEIGAGLGDRLCGLFHDAAMHTPVEVTERAVAAVRACGADCLVAFGGGSTTGLAKAVALRTGLDQVAIPTTYAGSEMTDILGETRDGRKTTLRNAAVVPEMVVYDPELTLGLPIGTSVTSGLNAMAHAVEGLYARDRNPVSSMMAVEGVAAFLQALPRIKTDPGDLEARSRALTGAWLCGTVLGTVGMALHHKICHTLGGSFDLPHAETHAVMLPYTASFNAEAVPDLLAPLGDLLSASPGAGLYDFSARLGGPLSLRSLGLERSDVDRAADIATRDPYWNPRPLDPRSIRDLLERAWEGERPDG